MAGCRQDQRRDRDGGCDLEMDAGYPENTGLASASCRYSRQRRGRSQRQDRSRARGRLDQAVGISCRRRLPMIKTARPRQRADSGFTLLEILIVVAIFGIFVLLAYGGTNSVLHTRSRVEIAQHREFGRASWRERVSEAVYLWEVVV